VVHLEEKTWEQAQNLCSFLPPRLQGWRMERRFTQLFRLWRIGKYCGNQPKCTTGFTI